MMVSPLYTYYIIINVYILFLYTEGVSMQKRTVNC